MEIKIKNFQAIKEKTISTDNGIVVVTGPTDTGKSSIYRAIKWLWSNRPFGLSHIRNGQKNPCVVELCSGVNKVKRIRSKKKNQFWVNEQVFDKVGVDVPKEVQSILNLNEINFQGQHDPLFLLSDTPGEAGRKLNEFVNLSIMDKVISYLNSKFFEFRKKVAEIKHQKETIEKELTSLEGADVLLKIAEETENLYNIFTAKQIQKDRIKDGKKSWEEYANTLRTVQDPKKIGKVLEGIEEKYAKLEEIDNRIQHLRGYIGVFALEKQASEIDLTEPTNLFEDMCQYFDEIEAKEIKAQSLKAKIKEWKSAVSKIKDSIRALEIEEEAYEEFKEKYKVCPTCGNPLRKKK